MDTQTNFGVGLKTGRNNLWEIVVDFYTNCIVEGEDDDLARRIFSSGFIISRAQPEYSMFTMIKHAPDTGNERNPKRSILLRRPKILFSLDGLNILSYRSLELTRNPLYTRLFIHVSDPFYRSENNNFLNRIFISY